MTEVMYDLVGTDSPNEFVELFNLSQTDTANLNGYTIKDKSSEDALVDSGFGRSIAAPYWNIYTAQESILTWDGRKKNGEPARIGIYIVKTTARDGSSGQLWENVQTVVLAKPL